MTLRVAINGFGRIGRTILRQVLTLARHSGIQVAQINDIAPAETCAYLFQYDSTFGPFPGVARCEAGSLVVDGMGIPLSHRPDLDQIPALAVERDQQTA